jgi:hypothetical protein
MSEIVKHAIGLTDQEVEDIIRAIRDAQAELCCGLNFHEANAIDARWYALAQRFTELTRAPRLGASQGE